MSVYARPEPEQQAELGWPSPPDPGDLSKRLARRRIELRLSTTQVAARANISRRYLEYLERYPATPGVPVLRRLAAALLTTPTTLLGGGTEAPPGHGARPDAAVLQKLSPAECRRLIAPGGIGRIAFSTVSGPVVLPVNFTVVGMSIVIRTNPGTLIEAHGDDRAAFEVDHVDDVLRQGWSVLILGQAHRVLQAGELRHVREEATVLPWPGGAYDVYVRIVPDQITGRRVSIGLGHQALGGSGPVALTGRRAPREAGDMFSRHPAFGDPAVEWSAAADPAIPSRSCCCPGRPVVKVIMPPASGRIRPIDLWPCGHHYRASQAALLLAGARVEELTAPPGPDIEILAEVR